MLTSPFVIACCDLASPHDAGASDELDEVEGELMKKQEDTPVDEVIVSHQLVIVRL